MCVIHLFVIYNETDYRQFIIFYLILVFNRYNLPEGTKSLALVVEDLDGGEPDGPIVPWVHWVVVNIPPTLKGLPEGFSGKGEELGGEYSKIKEGIHYWKQPGWRGPVLPHHGHRFEFKLYALDDELHFGNKVPDENIYLFSTPHIMY